jgi:hypothetical protein
MVSSLRALPFTLFTHARLEKKIRHLKYDLNALADFEQQCGMGIGQLLQMKAIFATARAMFWCGAKHEERSMTLEDAGDLIQDYIRGNHGTVNDMMTACFEIAIEQGALGVQKSPAGESDDSDPNVLEGTATESEAVSSPGASGSKNRKKLPSGRST